MLNIKKALEGLSVKIKQYFAGSEKPATKKQVDNKKRFNLVLVLLGSFVAFIVLLSFCLATTIIP